MTLAERRVAAGITRAKAAYTLHLSMAELDRIESMAQEATPRQALCMAKMYGCKPEELELGLDPDSLHGWRVYHGVGITALTALVSKYRPIGFYCASSRCGMNKHGVFVCRCGKCHPLSEE